VHTPGGKEKIFLQFILDAAPTGIVGLMMAGLFAAGMAPLTSMSSAFVSDLYKHARPDRPDRHYLAIGRAAVVAFGVILGLFATACIAWYDPEKNTLINFALGVMSFAYAGLLGVFFTAMFTKRGNSASAIASLISGFVVVTMLEPALWESWTARVGLADWSHTNIAFPWRLTTGAAIAFIVCCAGKSRPATAAPTP
jgi:Na+/proline symporter